MLAFSFDLLNSLILQIVLLSTKDESKQEIYELALFVTLGVLLVIVTIIHCSVLSIQDYRNSEDDCAALLHVGTNVLMLLATWAYFIGDNIVNFLEFTSDNKKYYTLASEILLAIGLAGFRFLPLFKAEISKRFDEDLTDKEQVTDTKRVNTIIKKITSLLPEIDGWFTLLSNISPDNSEFASCYAAEMSNSTLRSCRTAIRSTPMNCYPMYISAFWGVYFLILVMILPYLVILANTVTVGADKCLTKRYGVCQQIGAWLIIACFLIGDNIQPLDCTGFSKCIGVDDSGCGVNRIIKLATLLIAAVIYILTAGLIGILFNRKLLKKLLNKCCSK